MLPHTSGSIIQRFVTPLNDAMHEFGIDTILQRAAFLAQLFHESGGFVYMEELANGSAYEGRADLGNTEVAAIEAAQAQGTSPGRFYKGHGPMQITGYKNHRLCGEALNLDLVNQPKLITAPEDGCRAAAWFWRIGAGLNLSNAAIAYGLPAEGCDLNNYATAENFDMTSIAINGGWNGKLERKQFFALILRVTK